MRWNVDAVNHIDGAVRAQEYLALAKVRVAVNANDWAGIRSRLSADDLCVGRTTVDLKDAWARVKKWCARSDSVAEATAPRAVAFARSALE